MKKPLKNTKPYLSDVSGEEWSFVVPYLTLCRPDRLSNWQGGTATHGQ